MMNIRKAISLSLVLSMLSGMFVVFSGLPLFAASSDEVNFTRGHWGGDMYGGGSNSYVPASSDDFGTDFAVLHLGNGDDFTIETTLNIKRDKNYEYGFIFGMKDKDGDSKMTQANDEYYVLEHVGNQGRFGLQKVSGGKWPGGWLQKSSEELILPAGEYRFTLTVKGSKVTLSCGLGELISFDTGENLEGGFGICAKRTEQNFKNTVVRTGAINTLPALNSQYGGNWRISGKTYINSNTLTHPDFAYYNLGTLENESECVRVKGTMVLGKADVGFMVGVSDLNGNGAIEQNADSYYLICASAVNGGKSTVFISKNESKWGGVSQKKEIEKAKIGQELEYDLSYYPKEHKTVLLLDGEEFINYTDAQKPLSGRGYGFATKVSESRYTLEELYFESPVNDGRYYQIKENSEDSSKNDYRLVLSLDRSELNTTDSFKIRADFASDTEKKSVTLSGEQIKVLEYIGSHLDIGGYGKYTASPTSMLVSAVIEGIEKDFTLANAVYVSEGELPEAPEASAKASGFKIAGKDISEYKIIYSAHPFDSRRAEQFNTEYDFYRIMAEALAKTVKDVSGVTLSVLPDRTTFESENEILVGPTNRYESMYYSGMSVYEYGITVSGTKLLVGGGYNSAPLNGGRWQTQSFAATYTAVNEFDLYLKAKLAVGVNVIELSGDILSGVRDYTTISCIGDSITEGTGSTHRTIMSYPAVMQRILWEDTVVVNCGNSGKTMRSDLNQRYKDTLPYKAALSAAYKADLTFIMLGTNDSYFDKSFDENDDIKYTNDAKALVKELKDANSELSVVIMNCPSFYGDNTSADLHVRNLQAELVKVLTDEGYSNINFFDMNGFTRENVGESLFNDKLHPNDDGYRIIGPELAKLAQKILTSQWSKEEQLALAQSVKVDERAYAPDSSKLASGAVNILGTDLAEKYPVGDNINYDSTKNFYSAWKMSGTPFIYNNLKVFEGYKITDIDIPVYYANKGDTFTLSVVKYSHPSNIEYVENHTLTVTEDCPAGWISFHGLGIDVPEGCTLAFSSPTDTLSLIFLTKTEHGYGFYGSVNGSETTNATLAFNVYGKK